MKTNYQIKRNEYGSLSLLLPIAGAILAEYLAILSSYANSTYPIESLQSVMVMTEVAVGLLIAVFLLSVYLKGRICMYALDAVRLAAVVLLSICLYNVLEQRATLMGYVWFSDLESGNAKSVSALNYGVWSAVVYALTVLAAAATGAVEFVSAKKVARTREIVQEEIVELQRELDALGGTSA